MKLLFDQNLRYKLCQQLADLFPGPLQTRLLDLQTADDVEIWQVATEGDYLLVTQDADFADRAALVGHPPKVIWLRCGNQPTRVIEELLRTHFRAIKLFAESPDSACLEIV